MTNSINPYRMTIDLNVLDHLADGLYSSVAAVLTEAVANAWDADAQKVKISLDISNDKIWIEDDGIGMDRDAINERYLKVGYRRRKEGDKTPGGRDVMGRKGIGKLSLFSIGDIIEVYTKTHRTDLEGLRIKGSDLRADMEAGHAEYNPKPLSVNGNDFEEDHGTKILVTALKWTRLYEITPESLRRRLARRFSIIGSFNFCVLVNGTEVTPTDREDLKFVEYLWTFGDKEPDISECGGIKKIEHLDDAMEEWENRSWKVKGWIGTVDRPRRLATNEGNLNSIVVLARGRLVDEDILPRVTGAEVYTKYLAGQVEADFLDDTTDKEIVTSNRQRVKEDDNRVKALVEFLRKAMRKIADAWSGLRATDKTTELRENYPHVGEWLKSLHQGWQGKAEKLLERIATMEIGKEGEDQEESQKILLRHAIYGFERLRLRGDAEELERALSQGIEALLKLLADRDALEASFYHDIVSNRLEVIKELEQLVEEDRKERVLQKYLFDHLWLLDPAWERATGNEEMERRLRLQTPFKDDEKTKEQYGRVDIHYRTIAGKHMIVELKKVSVHKNLYDLAAQGAKYVDAVKDTLPPEEKDLTHIEVIFVVGKSPSEPSERIEQTMNGVAPGSRIIPYDLLIARARQGYAEYLDRAKNIDIIERLFNKD